MKCTMSVSKHSGIAKYYLLAMLLKLDMSKVAFGRMWGSFEIVNLLFFLQKPQSYKIDSLCNKAGMRIKAWTMKVYALYSMHLTGLST